MRLTGLLVASLLDTVLSQSVGFDPREATIETVHDALFSGVNTCHDVVDSFLTRIEALNRHVNAIIAVNARALDVADALDEALAKGNATGRLFCVPVLLKDNYDTSEMPTTGGCLGLADSRPTKDAPVVEAMKRENAIILGKANLHELALEGLSVSSLGGQTLNPYDFTRTPGGSSGGSGAAVAMSFSVFATGTDTVNSLRNPASANSLFSIRPTRGLITRKGVIPVSHTQDAVGPIARSVSDLAVALTVMSSAGLDDEVDMTSTAPSSSLDYRRNLTSGTLQGLRFGLLEGFFNRSDDNETGPVNLAMASAVETLRQAGVSVVSIHESIYNASDVANNFDTQRYEYREMLDWYLENTAVSGTRPHSFHSLYDGDKFLVIPSQYEYIRTAAVSSTSNATYDTVKQGIRHLTTTLQETFSSNRLDAVIYPEQKSLVVKIGSPSQSQRNGILAALTGYPVATIPIGFSEATTEAPIGVPIGMEILGTPFGEAKLLQIAYEFEQKTHVRRTPRVAEQAVETRHLETVPSITPEAGNIGPAYPVGVLS